MTEPTFDPRFDPAFQRGYEPSVHAPKTARSRPKPELIGEPPAAIEPEAPESAASEVPAQEQAPLRRGVNPYVVILWVVGVVFTLGSVALFLAVLIRNFAPDFGATPQDAAARAFVQFGYLFSTPLLTVGLGTIVGVIFLLSTRAPRPSRKTNA